MTWTRRTSRPVVGQARTVVSVMRQDDQGQPVPQRVALKAGPDEGREISRQHEDDEREHRSAEGSPVDRLHVGREAQPERERPEGDREQEQVHPVPDLAVAVKPGPRPVTDVAAEQHHHGCHRQRCDRHVTRAVTARPVWTLLVRGRVVPGDLLRHLEHIRSRRPRQPGKLEPSHEPASHSARHQIGPAGRVADRTFQRRQTMQAEPRTPHRRGGRASRGPVMARLGECSGGPCVTTRQVSALLRELQESGVSPRTVNKHRQVLSAIFNYGRREDTFALPSNPETATTKRREPPPAVLDFYEPEEVEALARAAAAGAHRGPQAPDLAVDEIEWRVREDAQDAELFRLAAFTGLRLGELLALRWSASDLVARRLIVQRAVSAGVGGSDEKLAGAVCADRGSRLPPHSNACERVSTPRARRLHFSARASDAGLIPRPCAAASSAPEMRRAFVPCVFTGCATALAPRRAPRRRPLRAAVSRPLADHDDRALHACESPAGRPRAGQSRVRR